MSTPAAAPVSRSATSTPVTSRPLGTPATSAAQQQRRQQDGEDEPLESALPPPQIFDVLPALHELLSRLLAPGDAQNQAQAQQQSQTQSQNLGQAQSLGQTQTQTDASTQPVAQSQTSSSSPQTQSQPQSQSLQPPPPNGTHNAPPTAQSPSQPHQQQQNHQLTTSSDAAAPLALQQLAAEASAVRAMVRRARESVAALPDVDRSAAEQEAELAHLREEKDRLKGVLDGLRVRLMSAAASAEAEAG